MSDMVERVAKAIKSKSGRIFRFSPQDAEELARAAIQAMREPTAEMVHTVGSNWGTALEHDWRTMIDAALGKVDA